MSKNIAFLGTPKFAVPILKSLYQHGYNIRCVFSQPPKKSFRGQKINKSPVQTLAENLEITVKTPSNIENDYDYIKSLKLDLAIVVAYGQIIPKNILSLSKNGFLNLHASLLPNWRGAAPIQRSIMNMDKTSGISVMKINENLDEGPIMNTYEINILENENTSSLSRRLSELGKKIITQNIEDIFNNKAKFIDQDNTKATYAKKIIKSEGKINWQEDSKKVLAKINGLNPKPGAWFVYKKKRYKVLKAIFSQKNGKVGEVLDGELTVSCGSNSISIIEIQKEGKNSQKTRDFLLGNNIKKGSSVIDE